MASPKRDHKTGGEFDELGASDIIKAFHVSSATVTSWTNSGCPFKMHGNLKRYSIFEVHRWLLSRETEKLVGNGGEGTLKSKKTVKEIELLETKIQKIREQYIEKSVHDQILAARAKSLSIFFLTAAVKNCIHYVGRTLEQLQVIRVEEARQAMVAYCGAADAAAIEGGTTEEDIEVN